MSKNIWILNHYAVTPYMPGGTRHYDFGKELVKRGYEVTIFASSFHYSQRKELKLVKSEKYKVENVDGVNFVWIKTFPHKKNDCRRVINMLSYMRRVYRLGRKIIKIDKNIRKPDIIIGSSVHLLAVFSAYWLSKYYKAKFIMEVRDLWPQTLVDMGKFKEGNPAIKILRFLEKFLYKKAERIIVLPPLAGKYISGLGIDQDKIIYIPNGVNLIETQPRFNLHEGDNNFKVFYVGTLGVFNRIDIIIKAACIVQDLSYSNIAFIFVGDGSEKNNLVLLAKECKLNNVIFKNPVSKNLVQSILSESDLCIVDTDKMVPRYGISPNKLFDYLKAEKPIIFQSDFPNSIIREAKCGIQVSADNPELLAGAIIKLYNTSPKERERMGQQGREYVEKYHNIPVLVNKLEKVI